MEPRNLDFDNRSALAYQGGAGVARIFGELLAQFGWAYLTAFSLSGPLGFSFGLILGLSFAAQLVLPYSVQYWSSREASATGMFFRSFANALVTYPLLYLSFAALVLSQVSAALKAVTAWFSNDRSEPGQEAWTRQFTASRVRTGESSTVFRPGLTLIMQLGNVLALALWITLAVTYLTPFVFVYAAAYSPLAAAYSPWITGVVAFLWGAVNHHVGTSNDPSSWWSSVEKTLWTEDPYHIGGDSYKGATWLAAFFKPFYITLLNLVWGVKVYLLDPVSQPFFLLADWLSAWDNGSAVRSGAIRETAGVLAAALLSVVVGVGVATWVNPLLLIQLGLTPAIVAGAAYLFFVLNPTSVFPPAAGKDTGPFSAFFGDLAIFSANALFSVAAIPVFASDVLMKKAAYLLKSVSDVLPPVKSTLETVEKRHNRGGRLSPPPSNYYSSKVSDPIHENSDEARVEGVRTTTRLGDNALTGESVSPVGTLITPLRDAWKASDPVVVPTDTDTPRSYREVLEGFQEKGRPSRPASPRRRADPRE